MLHIIRKLDRSSAESWAILRREALDLYPLAFGAASPDDPAVLAESFHARLGDEAAIFGAFLDTAMAGMVGVRRMSGTKERHKALIWGMYVTAGSRREGVGGMLLRAAIAEARSWDGVEQIHLAVSQMAEEAGRLYERHGFQLWGREPRALVWEGRSVDELHMVLGLR